MLLDDILEKKRERICQRKSILSLNEILRDIKKEGRDFLSAVKRKERIKIIGEIKHRSPTAKELIKGDPFKIAKEYEASGICALSIVTDEDFFGGSLHLLKRIKEDVTLPVLCKDFVIDPYQVYEAKYFGADALLLIASLYDKKKLSDMIKLCEELSLHPLVEIHTRKELEDALFVEAKLIGVNNRNLYTMELEMNTSIFLAPLIPKECIKIAESGIKNADYIREIEEKGYDAALIGEAFLKAENIKEKVKEFWLK